jgi:hypothetical protein
VVIVITDWARSGMTHEDRVIGELEAEAVLRGKVADKDPCNEAILERCTAAYHHFAGRFQTRVGVWNLRKRKDSMI